jgi:membrane-bound serine protease (ClpP class)
MGLASAAVLALVLGYALRAQRNAVTTGAVEITGEPATVIEWAGGEGYVRARGERWRARGEGLIQVGDRVDVTGMDGLMLHVAPRPSAHIGEST